MPRCFIVTSRLNPSLLLLLSLSFSSSAPMSQLSQICRILLACAISLEAHKLTFVSTPVSCQEPKMWCDKLAEAFSCSSCSRWSKQIPLFSLHFLFVWLAIIYKYLDLENKSCSLPISSAFKHMLQLMILLF